MARIITVAIVSGVLGVFFFMGRQASQGPVGTTSPIPGRTITSTGETAAPQKVKKAEESTAIIPAGEKVDLSDLPMNVYKTKSEHGLTEVNIEAQVLEWCTMGDLNAIQLDNEISKVKNFLLTIESLDEEDKEFKPIVQKVPFHNIAQGFRAKFRLPNQHLPKQLGVFLCKDSSNQGRCLNKPAEDINHIILENMKNKKEVAGYQPPDRTYFFQYVYFSKPDSLHFFQSTDPNSAFFDLMQRHIAGRLTGEDSEKKKQMEAAIASQIERAKSNSMTARSLAMESKSNSLKIIFPRLKRNPENCPKSNETPADIEVK